MPERSTIPVQLSAAAFDELEQKLRQAGIHHVFRDGPNQKPMWIELDFLGLTRGPAPEQGFAVNDPLEPGTAK